MTGTTTIQEIENIINNSGSVQDIKFNGSGSVKITLEQTQQVVEQKGIFSKETIDEIYMIDLIFFTLLVFVGFFYKISNFR